MNFFHFIQVFLNHLYNNKFEEMVFNLFSFQYFFFPHFSQNFKTLLFLTEIGDKIFSRYSPITKINPYCTYAVIGSINIEQKWYECRTCQLTDGKGICEFCHERCHAGHDTYFCGYSFRSFCDCGYSIKKFD